MPTWLNSGPGLLTKLHTFLRRLEAGLLVGLLLLMIVMAAYQVLARNLVGGGVVWGDPLVRIALLWITLVGAIDPPSRATDFTEGIGVYVMGDCAATIREADVSRKPGGEDAELWSTIIAELQASPGPRRR